MRYFTIGFSRNSTNNLASFRPPSPVLRPPPPRPPSIVLFPHLPGSTLRCRIPAPLHPSTPAPLLPGTLAPPLTCLFRSATQYAVEYPEEANLILWKD